jgi:hypothetical protein
MVIGDGSTARIEAAKQSGIRFVQLQFTPVVVELDLGLP